MFSRIRKRNGVFAPKMGQGRRFHVPGVDKGPDPMSTKWAEWCRIGAGLVQVWCSYCFIIEKSKIIPSASLNHCEMTD